MSERQKSKQISCQYCGKLIYARGIQSHIRLLHSHQIPGRDSKATPINFGLLLRELEKLEKLVLNVKSVLLQQGIEMMPESTEIKEKEIIDKEIVKPKPRKVKKEHKETDDMQLKLF